MTTTSVSTKLTVCKLSGRIGAVVSGLGPDLALDPETAAAVRETLNEHKALVFRGVDLDDEGQQRFAGYVGQIRRPTPPFPPSTESRTSCPSTATTAPSTTGIRT